MFLLVECYLLHFDVKDVKVLRLFVQCLDGSVVAVDCILEVVELD